MTEYYEQVFSDQCNDYSVIIDDDGRVCYAYLLLKNSLIGDVWLYNQSEAPLSTTWEKEEMPFLNSTEYIKEGLKIFPISNSEEVHVEWDFMDDQFSLNQIKIYIRNQHTATIQPGSKPGWSLNVKKSGPLAKVLNDK